MKYPVFALTAFSLFLFVSCQNNSGSTDASAPSPSSADGVPSNEAPASDVAKLNMQILKDFVAARSFSRQFTPTYDASFEVIKSMKLTGASLGETERAKILPLVEEAMKFRLAYDAHLQNSDRLDSLSIHLSTGQISLEDAQKEYVEVREQMRSAAAILPAEQGTIQSVKSKFEQAYPNAVKQ